MSDNLKLLQEQINLLSEKLRSMSQANIMVFSFLAHAQPKLIPVLSDAITKLLNHLEKTDKEDTHFELSLKSQLKQYLKYLKDPPKVPHFRFVDPENDDHPD